MNYANPYMNPLNVTPENSYTPMQVAELLGVKPSTVYAWLSRRELVGNKVGHRRFITKQQLNSFYEKRRTGIVIDYTYAPR
jgi:excisionase family DNA binding protein